MSRRREGDKDRSICDIIFSLRSTPGEPGDQVEPRVTKTVGVSVTAVVNNASMPMNMNIECNVV